MATLERSLIDLTDNEIEIDHVPLRDFPEDRILTLF